MTKTIRPKSDKLSIKIVYHCSLQAHSISGKMSSWWVTAPTSFICCKSRLVTIVLSFMCLHNMYITKVVTSIEIIAAMNRKISVVKLLKKESLLGISKFVVICLSFKYKISFFLWYWSMKSLSVYGTVSRVESNLEAFNDTGKVCWKVVLSIRIGGFACSKESVRLSNWSHYILCGRW